MDKGIERIGGRIGASRGPARIRKSFYRLANGCRHPINELTLLDLGDVVPQMDLETSHEQLGDIITFWIKKGILPIVLGGSHDLSFGSVSGLVQAIPGQEKIGLINIDSHLDIDVCARAYTPGASASQADGLTASEILQISFLAGKEKKVKLLDVCEVSPPLDIANMTVSLAARIIYCFLQGLTLR